MAEVSFKNINKVFANGIQAVSDFSLEIDDGELVVLVGPSGCGKSTLLRMLAGLEAVSDGELKIAGQTVNALAPQQRNIAMVFQNYALYPHMSVRRNLEFPLKMMHMDKTEIGRRVEDTAHLLGIMPLLENRPGQLSGGQRQRVAMGRAIVRQPSVFLMDEPLSNLDAKLRLQIRNEIAALQRRLRTTMLYVTHDQVEAMTLGDRVAVINRGRLQQLAVPQTLYERPANIFVAGFIGNPGMNIFKTRLSTTADGNLAIRWGERDILLPPAAEHRSVLRQHLDLSVYAGLRPEAIRLADDAESMMAIAATVTGIESLGHETLVYFHSETSVPETDLGVGSDGQGAADRPMVARLPGRLGAMEKGVIRLQPALEQLYLFDADGMLLSAP